MTRDLIAGFLFKLFINCRAFGFHHLINAAYSMPEKKNHNSSFKVTDFFQLLFMHLAYFQCLNTCMKIIIILHDTSVNIVIFLI